MRSRLLSGFVAAAVGGLVLLQGPGAGAQDLSDEVTYHRITFPVMGAVSYSNTWRAARTGHVHQGVDMMGSKLQPLLAAENGHIRWVRRDGSNMISVEGDSGWEYWYIHVNNDTPGTDDGANPQEWILAPGLDEGSDVVAGQFIGYMGDSGNAEGTSPHNHFEIHKPDGTAVNPYWSLMLAQGRRVNDRCRFDDNPEPEPSVEAAPGYWSTTSDGSVYSFGGAPYFGSMGGQPLAKPIIGLTATPKRDGYWQLSGDGGIFSFGDAAFHGSTGAMTLNQPVVGMAATPTGNGYWLVASDGGIFSFGDARYLGSTGGNTMSPIVDITPTPTGAGYWMTTKAGSVLPYGDARWLGGADKIGFCTLPSVVGMTPTHSGNGYWLQGRDGNVFAFGDAADLGSPLRLGFRNLSAVAVAAF